MLEFTKRDAAAIVESGTVAFKKRNPVYLLRLGMEFSVETNEGVLSAHAGDFVAHDPISGHVWPVAADYVKQHYEREDGTDV